jgi:hypothetical protein
MNTDFLYIQGAISIKTLKKLMNISLSINASKFVLWYYPETSEKKCNKIAKCFNKYKFIKRYVQPITTYWNEKTKKMEALTSSPQLYDLNENSIELLARNLHKISKFCDSLATYHKKKPEWELGLIFHEDMILFKNTIKNKDVLLKRKIEFSNKPPEN